MTETYRPRHICQAFRIEAPTLRGWHNQAGLNVGDLGSTGRRVYDLAAAAAVGFVARATGLDGTRGYLTLFAAIDIANKAAPHLAALNNAYRAAFGVRMLPEMGRHRPLILCDQLPSGAWEVERHDKLGSALMRITDVRPALLTLDPGSLLSRALLALPAQADVANTTDEEDA